MKRFIFSELTFVFLFFVTFTFQSFALDIVVKNYKQTSPSGTPKTGLETLDGSLVDGDGATVTFYSSGASNITGVNLSSISLTSGIKLKVRDNSGPQWVDANNVGYTNVAYNATPGSGFNLNYAIEVDWDALTTGTHTITWLAGAPEGSSFLDYSYTVNITAVVDGANTAPPPPTVVLPTISTGGSSGISTSQATLSGSSSSNGGEALSAYGITISGIGSVSGSGSETSWSSTFYSLNPNTTYTYYAYGTNTAGTQPGGNSSFTTYPGIPTVGSASNFNSTSVTANWSAPDYGASSYQIDLASNVGFSADFQTQTSGSTSFTFNSLTPEKQYFYRVRSVNITGISSNSGTQNFYTLSTSPSGHPATFNTVAYGPYQVNITFQSGSGIPNCDGYIILRRIGSAPDFTNINDRTAPNNLSLPFGTDLIAVITNSATSTFEDTGLLEQTHYYYTIIPFNYDGVHEETYNYKTDAASPAGNLSTPNAYPFTQASELTFSDVTRTSMTVNWVNGDGHKRILLGRMQYRINSEPLSNGVAYSGANSSYTSAPIISGAKLLYNGTGTNVNITNLTRYQLVTYKLIEYNDFNPTNIFYLQTEIQTNPRSRWTLRRDGMMEEDLSIDADFAYPNPAKDKISLTIDIFEQGNTKVELFSVDGKLASSLYNNYLPFGTHNLEFALSNINSGVYILIISKGNEAISYPLEVIK